MTDAEAYRLADLFYHQAAGAEMTRLRDRPSVREATKRSIADRLLEISRNGK